MLFTLASIVIAIILAALVGRYVGDAPASTQDQALGNALFCALLWILIFVGWIASLVVWAVNT